MPEAEKKTEGEPAEIPAEKTEDKTAGEIIREATTKESDKEATPEPDDKEMVPLSSLLEFKKENKKLKKDIENLVAKTSKGDIEEDDVEAEVKALAEEYDMDPKFASKLAKILEVRASKKAGEVIAPILEQNKKLSQKEKDDLINTAFTKHFAAALEKMPEYKDIVDPETIKALSLLSKNSSKTFVQLIEDTYGKAITGKRTIPETKPGGGKEPEPLDMDKARSDSSYFAEVMKNPDLKKEYNKRMLEPKHRRS